MALAAQKKKNKDKKKSLQDIKLIVFIVTFI